MRNARRLALLAVVATPLAGVALAQSDSTAAQQPSATIIGAVFLGPLCGGEPAGDASPPPCRRNYRPLHARIRITRTDRDARPRVVRSGPDGRFEVELDPGPYQLTPLAARGSSGAQAPRRILLTPDAIENVIIDYDTGSR